MPIEVFPDLFERFPGSAIRQHPVEHEQVKFFLSERIEKRSDGSEEFALVLSRREQKLIKAI